MKRIRSKEYYAKKIAKRSALRAAAALAAGRIPGKPGTRKFSPEEKKAANSAKWQRWKQKNLEAARKSDNERHKTKVAEKAIAAGRKPGVIGREKVLTDEQRLENRRANSRSYRVKHPEKSKQIQQEYHAAHKEESRARRANRRARIKGNGGTHTTADIRALFFEQKGICAWCDGALDEKSFHVDHWKPLSRGGSNDKSNLRLLHKSCNLSKGAKLPPELNHRSA